MGLFNVSYIMIRIFIKIFYLVLSAYRLDTMKKIPWEHEVKKVFRGTSTSRRCASFSHNAYPVLWSNKFILSSAFRLAHKSLSLRGSRVRIGLILWVFR